MTNSQKAFEEQWSRDTDCKPSIYEDIYKGIALRFWQAAWDARGKFDEEVLYNLATERFAQIGAQGMRVL